MNALLRRLFWSLPALLFVTLFAFWLISGSTPKRSGGGLPTFFNLHPTDVASLAWDAATRIAERDDPVAKQRLVGLGGAALPHVLPRLDTLSPPGRERVALALAPLRDRMGLPQVAATGVDALAQWVAFWDEHFVDFRPLRVRRALSRYGEHSTQLRAREVLLLDTFALDELMVRLVSVGQEVERTGAGGEALEALRSLCDLAAHSTGLPWTIPPDASVTLALETQSQWLQWWAESRFTFTAPQGVERFLAPLLQTRYATWAQRVARSRRGLSPTAAAELDELQRALPASAKRLGLASVGLLFGGYLSCWLRLTRRFSSNPCARFPGAAVPLSIGGLLLLCLVATTRVLGVDGVTLRTALQGSSGIVACCVGALLGFDTHPAPAPGSPWLFAYASRGMAAPRLAWHLFRAGSHLLAASLVPHCMRLLTVVTLIELGLKLPGIGQRLLEAVASQQVEPLLLASLVCAATLALLQWLSDWLVQWTLPQAPWPAERSAP